jgi:hypothetical protein
VLISWRPGYTVGGHGRTAEEDSDTLSKPVTRWVLLKKVWLAGAPNKKIGLSVQRKSALGVVLDKR